MTDGHFCILLKYELGWKGNFAGMFYCDRPLLPSEIAEDPSGRTYISIVGYGVFEELYVKRRIDDKAFDVFFDLN